MTPEFRRDTPPAPRDRLIVFTRLPQAGRTKTRLIPLLGPAGAAALQANMTQRVMAWARDLAARREVELEVRFAGGDPGRMRRWLGPGPIYRPQGPGGLGRRMHRALAGALEEGGGRAVLVGCDAPGLDSAVLAEAFDALERADLVLGPARDGGYYLIGLTRPAPEIFRGAPWGTDKVLARTLELAQGAGLAHELVAVLDDVDRPDDLPAWETAPPVPAASRVPGSISVIIPMLNEADNLARATSRVLGVSGVEALAVDGGSEDGSLAAARALGALALAAPRGRGVQMAAGAARAVGEYLLFLHADTLLPRGWEHEARRILARPDAALGAFEFAMDLPGWGARLIEKMVHWRSHWARLPYGDQALFLRAYDLERAGGFPRRPLMEDVELVRRMRCLGRVEISRLAAASSARRWQTHGLVGATLRNWAAYAAYRLGASPQRLARWYYQAPEGRPRPATGRGRR